MKSLLITLGFIFSTSAHAQDIPDRVQCNHSNSQYQLVLVLESPQLPEGYTAFGLKRGAGVVFKAASQTFKQGDSLLIFKESPVTSSSKEVQLNLVSKVATLINFHLSDLPDHSEFNCQF